MKALAAALATGPQPVREAAAEAMGAGALAPEQARELIDGYAAPFGGEGTPPPPAEPADAPPAAPREGTGDEWDLDVF